MARRASTSYDERDVKVRPGRGSRPRSKRRPAHAEAQHGLVVGVDRGRYTCVVAGRDVTAMTARELGRKAVVVGDRVGLVGDLSGHEGSLARIVRVEKRSTVLRRSADDDDTVERVVVANADQMLIVASIADPEPRPRLVDRCLVAAYDAGIEPLLCVTKSDLADPATLLNTYAPLQLPTVVTGGEDTSLAGLASVRAHLRDRMTVLVGHSGVGKSTLVNALVPGADRAIGAVNVVTGRGRHTSTNAVALPLPDGGWVIDTPGVRSFGLAHVKPQRLILAFPDLAAETDDCPRGCTHGPAEPECALDGAQHAGRVDPDRLTSYRRLLSSRERRVGD